MKIYGFCNTCHKVKNVRVSPASMATAGRGIAMGICSSCEDKAEEKRKKR